MEEKNYYLENDVDIKKQYYGDVRDKLDKTRQYRHDLAKHIQMLEYMAGNEGNLLYIFFQMKEQECNEKGITFRRDVSQIDSCQCPFMGEVEQISLFQNLLDNAIEANEKVERDRKEIRLFFRESERSVEISVGNRYPRGHKIDFETGKEKKEEHGIGFGIIKSIVAKKQGKMDILDDTENC